MNTTRTTDAVQPTAGDDAAWLAVTLAIAVRGRRATGGDALEEPTLRAALLTICCAYGLEPGEAMEVLGLEPGDMAAAFRHWKAVNRG